LSYLRRIREAGFQHVRINFFAFKFMDRAGLVTDDVLARLDRVIEAVIASDLTPVLDEHDYGVCQIDVRLCGERLKSFWKQISERYATKYERLVFELLNEPGGAMTGATWDALANELLATIRHTNRDRLVIVAAINSEDLSRIEHPRLPERDSNLALTVHYYAPIEFTHQGAPWSPEFSKLKNIQWGTPADRKRLSNDFDRISEWSRRENRPVYLGEFGVLEYAPIRDRQLYLGVVARQAEARDWAWAYWQFDHDFAAFNPSTESWVQPVLRSLIPR
jgi:endoglucanase